MSRASRRRMPRLSWDSGGRLLAPLVLSRLSLSFFGCAVPDCVTSPPPCVRAPPVASPRSRHPNPCRAVSFPADSSTTALADCLSSGRQIETWADGWYLLYQGLSKGGKLPHKLFVLGGIHVIMFCAANNVSIAAVDPDRGKNLDTKDELRQWLAGLTFELDVSREQQYRHTARLTADHLLKALARNRGVGSVDPASALGEMPSRERFLAYYSGDEALPNAFLLPSRCPTSSLAFVDPLSTIIASPAKPVEGVVGGSCLMAGLAPAVLTFGGDAGAGEIGEGGAPAMGSGTPMPRRDARRSARLDSPPVVAHGAKLVHLTVGAFGDFVIDDAPTGLIERGSCGIIRRCSGPGGQVRSCPRCCCAALPVAPPANHVPSSLPP